MEFKINGNLFFYYILKVKNWVIYGILYIMCMFLFFVFVEFWKEFSI